MIASAVFLLVLLVLARFGWQAWHSKRRSLPLPPGPVAQSFLGNISDIPTQKQGETYAKFSEVYGPVVHFRILTRHLLILNTVEAVRDLFEKKSAVYSDRPKFPMLTDLMEWNWPIPLLGYTEKWKNLRRVMDQSLHRKAAMHWWPIQQKVAITFLKALLDSPDKFQSHLHWTGAANIMKMAYGIDIRLEDDPYVSDADRAIEMIARVGLPGSNIVDWIPAARYLPEWFPGGGFQRLVAEGKHLGAVMLNKPFALVQELLASGKASPCYAVSLLEANVEDPVVIKEVVGTLYLAGADTTVSTLKSFFLSMVLNPEVRKKAQEELDRVVGRKRLPELGDLVNLPYIEGVVRECYRCHPVVPLGIAHSVMVDDTYNGYFIPKGTTVLANIWALTHDTRHFPDPDLFMPERYLKEGQIDPGVKDPREYVFGFGRRKCPGRFFADAAVGLTIATVLATFDISKSVVNGVEVDPLEEYRDGAMCCASPFECSIKPRSPEAEALITNAYANEVQ